MKGTPTLSSREHPLVVSVQSEARHHRLSRYRVLLSPNQNDRGRYRDYCVGEASVEEREKISASRFLSLPPSPFR
jgi:hypothetical protein